MALALLLNQRNGKNSKPGKGENFGVKFKATFLLDSSSMKPFGKLSGQLVIESPQPISHYGIRVQLEALCTLKFETKLDNRIRYHCKCGNILEGAEDKEHVDGYMESPVLLDLERMIKVDSNAYELQSGINTFGFVLPIPGEMLPAPFKNSYGSLAYKLVAYMRSESDMIVQIGEKQLRFSGYYNLSMNSNALAGAIIERSVKKSVFTGKKLVTVKLKLECKGFLPEEPLPFSILVQNPKRLKFKMTVQLLQKVSYSVNSTKKTTVAAIGNAEKDVSDPEAQTVWDGQLKIHKLASPTYSGKNGMYCITHFLQVKLDDYNLIKSEQLVYIGTTRETVEALIVQVNTFGLENRRGSIVSNASNTSGPSTSAKARKSQSQLSSRVASIEVQSGYDDSGSVDNIKTSAPPNNSQLSGTDPNQNDLQPLKGTKTKEAE